MDALTASSSCLIFVIIGNLRTDRVGNLIGFFTFGWDRLLFFEDMERPISIVLIQFLKGRQIIIDMYLLLT